MIKEDNKVFWCAFLKGFNFLSQELLLANLHAYGFSLTALRLMHSYLANRKQRARVKRIIAYARKFCSEFHNDLYSDLFFSFYLFVTFSLLCKKLILQALWMAITQYFAAESLDSVIKSLKEDLI